MKKWGCFLLAVALLGGILPVGTAETAADGIPEGMNRVIFYWTKEGADFDTSDMWIWLPGKDGKGYLFTPCAYGGMVTVDVPEGTEQVGFIVRTGCSNPGGTSWGSATKDFEQDRFAEVTGRLTEIYLVSGDGNQYTSRDGGATLDGIREFSMAAILSDHEIRYFLTPAVSLSDLSQVKVYRDGQAVKVAGLSSLNNRVITGIVTTEEAIDLTQTYEMEIDGYGRVPCMPTEVFDSEGFREAYTYGGDDLGAVIRDDGTVFKVWAPTASAVTLNLYEAGDGGEAFERLDMEKAEQGVWQAKAACGSGTYYTYSVTAGGTTRETADPYARAAGVNGDRSMVVDLAATDPEGFREEAFDAPIETYGDAVIWEVHVRDFSNRAAGSAYPGKYLAFTETGLVNGAGEKIGVDYLKELGVTHVHLQPVYDFATVDETALDRPQFNWGYDPKNYNVPEGSYATDPYHGEVRIREFKQMVQALHRAGIGVIMDVVYNHTWDLDSALNRTVPYYYYRFLSSGDPSNGSGCGNETASERAMFRKYMVDSVTYWLTEYRLDGFRFDLMALHDLDTMQAIEQAVHALNPKALLYGEGWTGGTSRLNPNLQCTQANIRKLTASEGAAGGIAVFNDAIRDGLKGSVFDTKDRGYISGSANKTTAAKTVFGLTGGTGSGASWKAKDAMVINYMTSHDNHTLWDKLAMSAPEADEAAKTAMVRLGASVVMISRGTPFFLAGEEMLRTKQGDGNSYKSSDEVNNLDWEALVPGSAQAETAAFYRGLIAMRKENAFLRDPAVTPECEILANQVILVRYMKDGKILGAAVINPHPEEVSLEWNSGLAEGRVLLRDDGFPEEERLKDGDTVTVKGKTVLLIAK